MAAVGSLRVELQFEDGSFTTRVVRAGTTLQQLEAQTGRTVMAVRRLESTMSQAGSAVTGFTTTVGLADSALRNLYTVFGSWSVSILRTAGEMERLTTQLTNMSLAATGLERAMEGRQFTRYLQDLSQQAPFALNELSRAFVRLRSAGIDPTTQAMNALVSAVAASGGGAQQLERASVAIQQMAGKGVLSMEELRQQLGESVPRAMPLLARAMGMTMSDLVKEISEGRVRAAPALQGLLAEFERTFGSSSFVMMNTFSGQLQILQTNFQRLQLAAAGTPGSGGFLDAARDAVTRMNEVLSSPDAQGFGVRIGQILANVTRSLMSMGEWVLRNADGLMALAQVVGGVLLLNFTRWLVVSSAAQFAPLIMAITTTTRSVLGLAVAFGVLTAAQTGAGVAASAASWTALFARMLPALSATTAAAGAFRVALISTGVVGGAVGGIMLLGGAVNWLRDVYRNLTLDAGASYQRLTQGASDAASVLKAQQEANSLGGSVSTARRNALALQNFITSPANGQRRVSTSDVDGENVLGSIGGGSFNRATAQTALDAQLAFIAEGERAIADRRIQSRGAEGRRVEMEGQQQAQNEIASIMRDFQGRRSAYDAEQSALQARMEQVQAEFASGTLDRSGRDTQTADIQGQIATRAAALDGELRAVFQTRLDSALAESRAAQAQSNDALMARSQSMIRLLNEQIADARRRAEIASSDIRGASLGLASGRQSDLDRQAQTSLTNMVSRTAELNEQLVGQAGNLARINSLMEQGRYGKLADDVVTAWRAAATALDEAEAATRRMTAATTASANINTGLARMQAEAQSYADTIGGSNLQSAMSGFLQFQRQMAAELASVAAGMNSVKTAAASAAAGMAVAVAAGNASESILRQSDGEGQSGRETADPSGRLRLVNQTARVNALFAAREAALMRLGAERGATPAQMALDLNRLSQNRDGVLAGLGGVAGRSDAAGGAGSLNILQQLQQRLAEVRAQADGAQGNLARVQSQIAQGKISGGMADQALTLARELDEVEKRAEAAREALSRYNTLVRGAGDSTEKANESIARMLDPNRPEASRQYETLRRSIAVNEASLRGNGLNSQANDLRDNVGPQRLRDEATSLAAQGAADQIRQTREIRAELGVTAAERIANSNRVLAVEEAAAREMIARSGATGATLNTMDEALTANMVVRREQVARANEGSLNKMMREWGDASTQMNQIASGFLDRFVDTLADGILSGKFNFEDLSKSFIKEIIKMELKLAASTIWASLRSIGGASGGAGGAGGAAGIIGSIASSIFGPEMASPGAGMANVPVVTSITPVMHGGGLVGMSGMSRSVSDAIFANAARYHGGGIPGLKNDEIPTILQKGEGVFTGDQMAVIGNMNRSYGNMEQGMMAIADAVKVPGDIGRYAPGGSAMEGGQPSAPKVTINMSNQTGQEMNAMGGGLKFDGESFVLDVVLRNLQRPGPLRDSMRG